MMNTGKAFQNEGLGASWRYYGPDFHRAPGHSGVKTTMVYTHILNKTKTGVISPADRLNG
ncbi:MAG: hypothetical protein JXQ65_16415 [Candidatus Marinimicrobia bacterium]|nr:hypothetical protein [Candidatus Neomarinimicrobiota bacterium]